MSMESDMVAWLATKTALTAALGNGNSMRVYYNAAPQSPTTPYVVYSRVDAPESYTHQGHDGIYEVRMQVNVVSDRHDSSNHIALRKSVRDTFAGFSGTWNNTTTVESVFKAGDFDTFDEQTDCHVSVMDFMISHR